MKCIIFSYIQIIYSGLRCKCQGNQKVYFRSLISNSIDTILKGMWERKNRKEPWQSKNKLILFAKTLACERQNVGG
jgi:hypothetical protein